MQSYSDEKTLLLYSPASYDSPKSNAYNAPTKVNINDTSSTQYKLYHRRWYILLLFSLLSLHQSFVWITFGAVADTAKKYYNTTDANINLLASLGPIAFIPVATASSWAIGEYGLRYTSLGAMGLVTFAAILRCFATSSSFWIVILAQTLNAAAGPIVMSGPPALSAAWFGVNERTFATAVAALANMLGNSVGFLTGLFVHDDNSFLLLLYVEGVVTLVIFIGFILYFPSAPPTPPSTTASVTKIELPLLESIITMLRSTWDVIKHKDGLVLVICGGWTFGVYSGWGAMVVLILMPLGFSQMQSQWLGLVSTILGIFGGLCIGYVHDKFRRFKLILIILFLASGTAFVVFSLATEGFWTFPFAAIMAISTFGGFLFNSLYPLTFEALVEVTFPVKEEISAGLMSMLNNFACLMFLLLGDYIPPSTMNWLLAGSTLGAAFMIMLVKQDYKRTNVDLKS